MEGEMAMLTLWIVVIVLGVLELFETVLLVLLLRALGKLKQQKDFASNQLPSPQEWGLAVGEQAPLFVAADDKGNNVRLDDCYGKKRIVAFVSPGCSACSGTIEALNIYVRDEQPFALFVLGSSDHEQNRVYAARQQALMPILTDHTEVGKNAYRVQGVPFLFILDEEGIIRAKGLVTNHERLQQVLANAFAQEQVVR